MFAFSIIEESGHVGVEGEEISLECIKTTLSAMDGISKIEISRIPEKLLEERKASQFVKRIDYLKGKVALDHYQGVPGDFIFQLNNVKMKMIDFFFSSECSWFGKSRVG